MASPLDLQQQEQLDALKSFWARFGTLITWVLIAVLGGLAAWSAFDWYKRSQAVEAAAMLDALERAAVANDAARVAQAFTDLREQYPRTAHAAKGGLVAARVLLEPQRDAARAALQWVADQGRIAELREVARLRLAGVLLDDGQAEAALRVLDTVAAPAFAALVADRRGDALLLLGRRDEARAAYQAALAAMSPELDYRQLVEAKLVALGGAPMPVTAGPAAAAAGAAR